MKTLKKYILLSVVAFLFCVGPAALSQAAPFGWHGGGGHGGGGHGGGGGGWGHHGHHGHGGYWPRPVFGPVIGYPSPQYYGPVIMKKLNGKLGLNNEQAREMDNIQAMFAPRFSEISQSEKNGVINKEEAQEKRQSVLYEMERDMACILTSLQMENAVSLLRGHLKLAPRKPEGFDTYFTSGAYDDLRQLTAASAISGDQKRTLEYALNGYYDSLNGLSCKYTKQTVAKDEFAANVVSLRSDMLKGVSASLPADKRVSLTSWMNGHFGILEYLPIGAEDIKAASVRASGSGPDIK